MWVNCLDVAPNRPEIAVSIDGSIKIFSLPDLRVVAERRGGAYDLRYSPDGNLLAHTHGNNTHPWPADWGCRVELCDARDLTHRRTIQWFYGTPLTVAFGPDGRSIVVGKRNAFGEGLTEWRVRD